MFDLTTLALKDTFDLQLRHPVSGEPLFADGEGKQKPVTITLYGTSSKQYRNAVTAMQNRQLKRTAKKEKVSAEVMREEGIELLVACVAGAQNLGIGGSAVKDESGFRTVFSDPKLSWIKDQVDEALGDTSNFLAQ